MLTNSYILYCKIQLIHLSTKTVSHYEFIKQFALTWMDPKKYGPYANEDDGEECTQCKRKSVVLDLDDDEIVQPAQKVGTRSSSQVQCLPEVTVSSIKSKRNNRINDLSLDPASGSLNC